MMFQGKRAPDDNYYHLYTAREARDDVFRSHKASVIEGYMSSWPPGAGTNGGSWMVGTERLVAFRHMSPRQ